MWVHFLFYFVKLLWLILLPAAAISLEPGRFSCNETCGNVAIPSPFGIKEGCYPNSWFKVSCKRTNDGKRKPFISRINLELIGSYSISGVTVNSPVTRVNCGHKEDRKGTIAVGRTRLKGSPFSLSQSVDSIGVIGCGNLATFVNNQTTVVGGCLQPRCGNMISNGCFSLLTKGEDFESLTAIITKFYSGKDESKRCNSMFVFAYEPLNLESSFFPDINNSSTQFPITLEWTTPIKCDLGAAKCQQLEAESTNPNSRCSEKCGDVDIVYPFGIRKGCYKGKWYQVICQKTSDGPTPFISKLNLPMLSVSFPLGIVTVNHSVSYFNCPQKGKDSNGVSVNLTRSPFLFSNIYNRFGSIGCGNLVTISNNQNDLISSCLQPSCGDNITGDNITCVMPIPPRVRSFIVNMAQDYSGRKHVIGPKNSSCGITFAVSKQYYIPDSMMVTSAASLRLPVELEWAKPKSGKCKLKEGSKTSCTSDGKYCWRNLNHGYICVCSSVENSVSYSSDACAGTHECKYPKLNYCHMLGLKEPSKIDPTSPTEKFSDENVLNLAIIIFWSTGFGAVLLGFVGRHMYKALKRRQNKKLRQKYFKRNGGLLLQQQSSASEGNVDRIKLFSSKELEKATDYYNENLVLGQGGQGTVYKGMLADGSIVAIKKSKTVEGKKLLDDKGLEQFINEVIILSQINHRNVVKLLGCCLETEFPLLVYEFIPNGTLSRLIEDQNDEFLLTWEMRKRIAIDIGNALSYLHSSASAPIYHRDIKSSNILLDDKYRAKVSDFGTSRSIALEQTHLTTRVQGTFGYMDPEYFRSNQFTEKSDVYSFGVVLVELLTGQKPISSQQSEEARSLLPIFLLNMKENTFFDILDPRVVNNGPEEEIVAVAKLAKRCLNLNGKKRPTMRQVAMELELIGKSEEAKATVQQIDSEDIDYGIQQSDDEDFYLDDTMETWTMNSHSTM